MYQYVTRSVQHSNLRRVQSETALRPPVDSLSTERAEGQIGGTMEDHTLIGTTDQDRGERGQGQARGHSLGASSAISGKMTDAAPRKKGPFLGYPPPKISGFLGEKAEGVPRECPRASRDQFKYRSVDMNKIVTTTPRQEAIISYDPTNFIVPNNHPACSCSFYNVGHPFYDVGRTDEEGSERVWEKFMRHIAKL
ncbi:hypothetical protein B0H14DRAFT_3132903 [Mycena olivaceomarginata]|nr:hypothetical protein B0H14DRAFT_3132903 [Mycena olivaceomarginata]